MGFTLIQLIKHRMSRERMKRRRDMVRTIIPPYLYALLAKIVRDLGEDVVKASSMVCGG